MRATSLLFALFCAVGLAGTLTLLALPRSRPTPARQEDVPPPPNREFRAAWVATVANIDWPSKPGLPVAQQKAQMLAILNKAAALKLNALIFQVRPACDALYPSKLEPWSEYLTGRMGQAPEPEYDPLALWIAEAHKRGIELHAWFNPYRAHHPTAKSPISEDHVSKRKPDIVRVYGSHLWLDPGAKATQDYSVRVVMDVVKRYDIDGVHIDDYFYPYKEKGATGNILDFPDEPTFQRYVKSGGELARDDWRRENVNIFVERVYREIKAAKPWVKFGISPFGIWRPGYPAQIQGFDAYKELYADARKWLREGWVDYWTPQLYWPIGQAPQSYPVLLKWWGEQNLKGRNLWPGNYTSRVGDGSKSAITVAELVNQIKVTRSQESAPGNVHFSMAALMDNRAGLSNTLARGVYAEPALVPPSPWLDSKPPATPRLTYKAKGDGGRPTLYWKPGENEKAWLWVVQTKADGQWSTEVLPEWQDKTLISSPLGTIQAIAVSAVDRCGNQSAAAVRQMKP